MAAPSPVQICNIALGRIGQRPIAAFTDGTATSTLASVHYDPARQSVLRASPWRFATKRKQIAVLSDSPAWGWTYQYQWPDGALAILKVSSQPSFQDSARWESEGRQILTNISAPIYVKYTDDVTDTALFDPMFVDALAEYLASEIVFGITKRADLRKLHLTVYETKISDAEAVDRTEIVDEQPEADDFIVVRR